MVLFSIKPAMFLLVLLLILIQIIEIGSTSWVIVDSCLAIVKLAMLQVILHWKVV